MIAIRIEHLGKLFSTPVGVEGSRPEGALRLMLGVLGFERRPKARDGIQRTAIIAGWILRDVSLDIEEGSVVCLVGASGSGKSVLLRILAGVSPPTTGRIELHGSVSSLLGAGDNLDSRLTALQNIESYRRLSRTPEAFADSQAEEVIAFAGLEGFEDMPVRTYSTGMTMRLSIALALHGNPSILLIDDVLGVGDIAFQQKCVERLLALKQAGCTMVLALSDEGLVRRLATRVITLGSGHAIVDGPLPHSQARQVGHGAIDVEWQVASQLPENDVIALRSVSVVRRGPPDEPCLSLSLGFEIKAAPLELRPLIDVTQGATVLFRSLHPYDLDIDHARSMGFTVEVPSHILCDGTKRVMISAVATFDGSIYSLKAHDAVVFTVSRHAEKEGSVASMPLIAMSLPWEIEPVVSGEA
jgi:ABC-type polysaccharide/polyol phosphate transport system ATPase subunit